MLSPASRGTFCAFTLVASASTSRSPRGCQLGSRMNKWRIALWIALYIGLLVLIGAVKVCLK
jgi:hypothetical protein